MSNNGKDVQLSVPDVSVLAGKYVNNVSIAMTKDEIVLDFMFDNPVNGHMIQQRLIMRPEAFKNIAEFLFNKTVPEYEQKFDSNIKIVKNLPV